jgi:O-antigen ligase
MAVYARMRRVEGTFPGFPPEIPQASVNPFGVNAELAQYNEEELELALETIKEGGFHWVRQTFPWAEIEPERGHYMWEPWDTIVEALHRHGLKIIAVLDTSPAWASKSLYAPPKEIADFGRFAHEFAKRYEDEIDYYQIWDEPNLSSHWGDAYVDPRGYARLLREGYIKIKSADKISFILTAGLAPNVEGGPINLNEVAFLRGVYEAGGGDFFDIVAVKPYGFDTGPEERCADLSVLNFSRAKLVREVMTSYGDEDKAVWAVEFGWNSLPKDWKGSPSIWGEVSEEEQARYASQAIEIALDEWPWMGVLAWASFQPDSPHDDPLWGFALVDEEWKPRKVYESLREMARREKIAYVGYYRADHYTARYQGDWRISPYGADIPHGAKGDASLLIAFKGTRFDLVVRRGDFWGLLYVTIDGEPANALPKDSLGRSYIVLHDPLHRVETITLAKGLSDGLHEAKLVADKGWGQWAIVGWVVSREADLWVYYWALFLLGACAIIVLAISSKQLVASVYYLIEGLRRLEGRVQFAIVVAAYAIFYFSPWLPLSLLSLALLAAFIYLRLDLGLALVAFSIPFFLYPKHIKGFAFSMVEITTLLCTFSFVLKTIRRKPKILFFQPKSGESWRKSILSEMHLISGEKFDLPVLFFFAIAALSLLWAENFGVAMREFRVVVFEPVLFYFILSRSNSGKRQLWTIVDALLLAAFVVSIIGLYQYFFTADVIAVEGVRRIRGVYGSPNNLSLFLGRVVPILASVSLFGSVGKRRFLYAMAGIPIIVCLFLTFSRGAWLLGLPFALLFIGLMRGRKAAFFSIAGVVLIALSLIPLFGTERFSSLLYTEGGTTFLRIKLWQGTLNMIRDHPLLGVGLDNFLYQYRTRYVLPEAWEELDLSHPHNILLDYWTRLGVLGVAALVWLEVAFFKKGLRLYRRFAYHDLGTLILGLMASMVNFLAHGLVDNSYFLVDLAFIFCLTLGIIARASDDSVLSCDD